MTIIHPHWQSTDDARDVPSASGKNSVHIRVHQAAGSRRPAAILGIFLVLSLALLLQNVHALTGQLAESSLTIRITPGRLEPASTTVSPGQTITWKNADTKPHILSSETLLTTDGLLYSTAIFPEEEFRVHIPEESPEGEHSYVSLTDPTISGTLRIKEKNIEASPPLPPPPLSPPKNPFTLQTSPPSKASVAPPPVLAHSSQPLSHPKPFRHPETGIPLGISSMASVVVLLFLTRRIVRSPHAQVIRP